MRLITGFKLELINEILASKEMYIARYYIDREKWIPAINRFKKVANDYDETIYVEEALHRLVELHYKLGLIEEFRKYASLLDIIISQVNGMKKLIKFSIKITKNLKNQKI